MAAGAVGASAILVETGGIDPRLGCLLDTLGRLSIDPDLVVLTPVVAVFCVGFG